MTEKRRRALLVAASALYLVGLWWMTLRPEPYDPEVGGVLAAVLAALAKSPATAWITFDVVEFAANVAMFLPLGALVVAWGGRWWLGIPIGFAVSGVIEILQFALLDTRVADPRDLVSNTLGAAVGAALASVLAARRPGARAPRLSRG